MPIKISDRNVLLIRSYEFRKIYGYDGECYCMQIFQISLSLSIFLIAHSTVFSILHISINT